MNIDSSQFFFQVGNGEWIGNIAIYCIYGLTQRLTTKDHCFGHVTEIGNSEKLRIMLEEQTIAGLFIFILLYWGLNPRPWF